jgi:CDP-glycerol glycerophosphotransferase (TagB/SpsB family)
MNYVIPKGNIVTFCSFPDLSDNAEAVYRNLSSRYGERFKYVWLLHEPVDGLSVNVMDKNTIYVYKYSLLGYLYFARSRYVFFTHGLYWNSGSIRRQTLINLWHGMPLKRILMLEGDTQVPDFTYTIATSPFYREILCRAFNVPESKVLVTGLPRTDLMFNTERSLLERFCARQSLDVNSYRKIVMWLPTYRYSAIGPIRRDGTMADSGLPLSVTELENLDSYLRMRRILLLVKLHPFEEATAKSDALYTNIRMFRSKDLLEARVQLHELLSFTDALVTDYSSIYLDYLLLDRPVAFTLSDIETYRANRGFIFEPVYDWLPGEKITCLNDFILFLENLLSGQDPYAAVRKNLREIAHSFCDDGSCERLMECLGL